MRGHVWGWGVCACARGLGGGVFSRSDPGPTLAPQTTTTDGTVLGVCGNQHTHPQSPTSHRSLLAAQRCGSPERRWQQLLLPGRAGRRWSAAGAPGSHHLTGTSRPRCPVPTWYTHNRHMHTTTLPGCSSGVQCHQCQCGLHSCSLAAHGGGLRPWGGAAGGHSKVHWDPIKPASEGGP